MGIILGFSLSVGIFIGLLISLLLAIVTIIIAVRNAKTRIHVRRVFIMVALVSLPLLALGVHCYPYNAGDTGSNYSALFGHYFVIGLAYAVLPGMATLLALLATRLCPRIPANINSEV